MTENPTTISIRSTLATILALAAIAGAVALTVSDASASPDKAEFHSGAIVAGHIGAGIRKCYSKRIFFENCNWVQMTCDGQVVSFRKLNCPDLR